MRIVIPDDYQDAVRSLDCYRKLAGHEVTVYHDTVKDVATLAARFQDAEALVLIRERTQISELLLALLPKLKLISQTGLGMPHIDLAACTHYGVAVAAGGGSPYATAELTWALVLASMRHIPQELAQLRASHWQTTLGLGLRGRLLGVFGYGKIGSLVAGYGRAFGMKVIVWGREGSLSRAKADGYELATNQSALFETSDVLSLHIKMTEETRGIVTANDLAKMKSSALLVNTSRALLIDPGVLEQALQAGQPGMAAVNVYEEEPVTGHPLMGMDNVICTPHLGYVEKDSYENFLGTAFEQVLAFAAGKPINVVNPEALH